MEYLIQECEYSNLLHLVLDIRVTSEDIKIANCDNTYYGNLSGLVATTGKVLGYGIYIQF